MPRLPLAISLMSAPLLAQGVAEAPEPNASTATATALPAGVQGFGDIAVADEDWFEITLAAAADYNIWTGPGFSGQIGDTRVRILAADGVTQIIDVDDGNTATHGDYTTLQGTLPAGTYYVAVRGFDGLTTGSYTLDVALAPPGTWKPAVPPLTPAGEGPENNDPRPGFGSGTATAAAFFTRVLGDVVAGGQSGTGIAIAGKDYDWYELDVTATATYVFRTTATPQAPPPFVNDTVVHLCDASFTRLAFNDDFGSTFSELSYDVTSTGTYYVVVSGYFSNSAGSYYLDIIGPTPPLPTGAAPVTVFAGGCAGTAGTPLLETRLSSTGVGVRPERAIVGSQYWLDGTNLPPSALLFQVIGIFALATPFDLTAAGAPGCLVEVDPLDQAIGFATGAGEFWWGLTLPADVAFVGLPIEQQLIVFDPPANALGITASNRVAAVLGVLH